jgi:hypothetical protein
VLLTRPVRTRIVISTRLRAPRVCDKHVLARPHTHPRTGTPAAGAHAACAAALPSGSSLLTCPPLHGKIHRSYLSDLWAPRHAVLCVWKPERRSFTHTKSRVQCPRSLPRSFFRSHSEISRQYTWVVRLGLTQYKSLQRKPSVKSGALSDSFNISKKRVD